MNYENLFFAAIISAFAIVIGYAVSWFILWLIENPLHFVNVGLWVIFTLLLYFSYERHLERKKNEL